jgi:hypothetical protein
MQVVRIDEKGRALDHVVAVKKNDNENVIWVALDKGGPWKVTFDKAVTPAGSPFTGASYTVPQGGTVRTEDGPVNGNVKQTFKYNVRNEKTNGITDDPDVDIE